MCIILTHAGYGVESREGEGMEDLRSETELCTQCPIFPRLFRSLWTSMEHLLSFPYVLCEVAF